MNRNEVYEMLVEYAEGTLDAGRSSVIEEELKKSSVLRNDLALLRSTFEKLQVVEEQDVSSHYFTNFLPRLREKVEQKKSPVLSVVPSWLQTVAAPVMAVTVIGIFIGLYNVLMPDNSMQTIFSIVQSADQGEVEQLIADDSPSVSITNFALSSPTIVNPRILDEELIASSTLFENIVYDRQILSQLEEQDVELIVQQLGSGAVQ